MIWFPSAKINLGLQVLRKRPDGYHDLRTCFYPIPWYDILEVVPSPKFEFTSSGLPIPGEEGSNLCIKAYYLLKEKYDLPPVKIHLHKVIPMGAGLGGGSSDGASTLKGLNEIFNLGLSKDELLVYAAKLGSDCPFFLHDSPMLASGRGEILEPANISLKGTYFFLVNPNIHVSTKDAFQGLIPNPDSDNLTDVLNTRSKWKSDLKNDFEELVFCKFPEIKEIKTKLYKIGAEYAALTGTGSTVYGLFKSLPSDAGSEFPNYKILVKEISI